jgi:hypothetical protein
MAADEKMTINERRKYLRQMQKRYKKGNRQAKSELLDEMVVVTGQHRKHLTRLMNGSLEREGRHRERGKTYGADVAAVIATIAASLDWVCAERVQPSLVWMADHLERHGELQLFPGVRVQLGTVSVSTVRRILAQTPRDRPRLPRPGPTQATHLRRQIPARRIPWQETVPGHFEVDLVHHSGPTSGGHYIHSLQMIDVATGWSERVATLGRGYVVMCDGFERILARLPFPVLEIHPDNGSEFLNSHLVRFWQDRVSGVDLSRSRPYHKNDNRFAEQGNHTLIRAYLGDDRFDTVEQTILLNQLYDHLWLYHNFFQPGLRLTEKLILPTAPGSPARVIRRFAPAQTPLDRLCQAAILDDAQQAHLLALRDATNPAQLRRDIYTLLDQFFALPNADVLPDRQDVYLTLFAPHLAMKGQATPVTLSIE